MITLSFVRLARRSFRLMAGAIMLWSGGVLLFISGSEIRDERRYRAEARITEARVVRKELRRATEQASTAYLLTFRLDPAGGTPTEQTEEVPAVLWESVEPHGTVAVEYLPGSSPAARVRRARQSVKFLWGVLALGAALAGTGAFLTSTGMRRVLRQLAIVRHGKVTEGVVTSVRETNYTINKVTQWAVDFDYRDDAGRTHRGESGPVSPQDARDWSIGDKGAVKFDPEHPERHVWMGRRV